MADRTQRRMVERDASPRDPFAELTKIMGFDPRVPVRPAPVAANAGPVQPKVSEEPEDFGIDLEKELMGAFEEPALGRDASAAVEPVSSWPDEAAIEDLDAGAVAPTTHASAALDFDALSLDDGFEEAFTASLEQELALDEEWAAQDTGFVAAVGGLHSAEEIFDLDPFEDAAPSASPAGELASSALDPQRSDIGRSNFHPQQAEDELGFGAPEGHPAPALAAYRTLPDGDSGPAAYDEHAEAIFYRTAAEPSSYEIEPHAGPDGASARADAPAEAEIPVEAEVYETFAGATANAGPLDPELELSFEQDFETLLADGMPSHGQPEPRDGAAGSAVEAASPGWADDGDTVTSTAQAAEWHDRPRELSASGYGTGPDGGAWTDEPGELAPEYISAASQHHGAQLSHTEFEQGAPDPSVEDHASAYASPSIYPSNVADEPAPSSEHDSWNADEFVPSSEADALVSVRWHEPVVPQGSEPADGFEDHRSIPEQTGSSGEQYAYEDERDGAATAEWQEWSDDTQLLAHHADDDGLEPAYAGSAAVSGAVEQADAEPAGQLAEQAYEPELEASSSRDDDPVQAPQDDDPFAALAAMAAQYRAGRQAPNWRPETAFTPVLETFNAQPAPAGNGGTMQLKQPIRDDVPDIETVDVPEQPMALADDLDIPDVAYAEQPRPAASYDDLDAEFAGLLQEMASGDPARVEPAAYRSVPAFEPDVPGYDPTDPRDYGEAASYPAEPSQAYAAASLGQPAVSYAGERVTELSQPAYAGTPEPQWSEAGYAVGDDLAFDDQNFEQIGVPEDEPREAARRPMRRGLLVAAVVGGVALLGGIGAAALSFGDGDLSGAPVLVRADTGPLKVRPENPGGTQVPNQDSKVYETVTGTPEAEPAQDKLLTTEEEPLDVAEPEAEMAVGEPQDEVEAAIDAVPGDEVEASEAGTPNPDLQDEQAITAKGEDRLEQVIAANEQPAAAEMIAVAPRKVRTMIVKPDGTLVPREVTEPEPVAVEPPPAGTDAVALEPASEEVAAADAGEDDQAAAGAETDDAVTAAPGEEALASDTQDTPAATGAVATSERAAEPLAAAPADTAEPAPAAPARRQTTQTTPASMKVAPARPAEQPVDIVGEVKPDQTAALAAPAAGAWSMQIASQPTEASARSSYADLARRYGSVLAGRSASIVKAEVTGKGTYYRVRVPASSRNEAVELCTRYKAAGGNCFVSK